MATEALIAQVTDRWKDSFERLNGKKPGVSGLLEFTEAWTRATGYLHPLHLDQGGRNKPTDPNDVKKVLDILQLSKRLPALLETFLEDIKQSFYMIKAEFDASLSTYAECGEHIIIYQSSKRLLEWHDAWEPDEAFGFTIRQSYHTAFQSLLFSIIPPTFLAGFRALCVSTLPTDDQEETTSSSQNHGMWETFDRLGLLDRYENIIASVGYDHIEKHVLATCTGKWAEPVLEPLRDWMSKVMVQWMVLMYARNAQTADDAKGMLQNVGSRFDFHMAKTVCDLRTKEIFDIIIEHPESNGALLDLKECLQRVDQRAALVKSLRMANRKRLLHPGADTRLILTQYVATIKCLRVIDPPGVLLFKVADPIRRYLRDRPDTIRCIVASLVGDEDSGDSLVDENEPIQPLQAAEAEDYSDMNWDPEPIDAGPNFRANKPSDVVSTLVSIYDSRDLFVKELQVLLAQRLLAIKEDGYEKVDKERRNIEILKIRFGEAALQVCEVMLKDMSDSKRIDQHIQTHKASVVHPTIISRHFWPVLESADIVMPGQFKALQEQYSKEFVTFKPDKKLRWLSHLGTVHLEVELEDRTIVADVPPLEAAFIELFSTEGTWSLTELMAKVGMTDRTAAIKAILTWVDLGVLKEVGGETFRLLEIAEVGVAPSMESIAYTAEAIELPPPPTLQEQQAEQMRVYWKFIEGMLTNLGPLPIDRIQAMLKLAPNYDQTVEQLAGFMEAAKREGLVSVSGGLWRLESR